MGLWEWNIQKAHSVWNAKEYELLGLAVSSCREPTERFFSRVHPEDAEAFRKRLDGIMNEGSDWRDECRIIRPNGEVRWLAGVGRLFRDESGRPLTMIGVNYDITERKDAEKSLQEAHELLSDKAKHLQSLVTQRTTKLQDAMSELEAFSYSVAHDLRAPLRAMQGYARELMQEQLSPAGVNYLGKIERAAERLDRLTREVLTYSRLSREEIVLTNVNLDKLVHEIVDQYPEITCQKDRVQIQSPLLSVTGHESLLTQAISNLLINACKFVKPGAQPDVMLHTTLWHEEGQEEEVCVCVTDKGIGIEPVHSGRLFKMFEKIHPEYKYPGTGIGLAIVKKAAERMNGAVGFESKPSEGSTFWIRLKAGKLE